MDLDCLAKLVFALSALTRQNPQAQKEIWKLGAFKLFGRILNLSREQLRQSVIADDDTTHDTISTEDDPSSKPAPSSQEEEENKRIIASIDITEIEDKVKARAQELKKESTSNSSNQNSGSDPYILWQRLSRKIVFFLHRLMTESQQFKLVLLKDQDMRFLPSLAKLLETGEDLELKEEVVKTLQILLLPPESQDSSSSSAKTQAYLLEEIKNQGISSILHEQLVILRAELETHHKDNQHYQRLIHLTDELLILLQ